MLPEVLATVQKRRCIMRNVVHVPPKNLFQAVAQQEAHMEQREPENHVSGGAFPTFPVIHVWSDRNTALNRRTGGSA